MKNTIYLLLLCAVVSFVGCQQDNVEVQSEETEIERSSDRRNRNKVNICHCTYGNEGPAWKIINISKNAVRSHLRHGDFEMSDRDNDGYYKENPCVPAAEADCDDRNRYVNPACAEDPTNGIDDNCDGQIDEGGVVDADGDDFNDDVDCDDNNPNVNPGATEVPYNGLDDDCDPTTLDDDLDGDGFNDDVDCDDTNADINPDAEEIMNNDIDEDCDGEAPYDDCEALTRSFLFDLVPVQGPQEGQSYTVITSNPLFSRYILQIITEGLNDEGAVVQSQLNILFLAGADPSLGFQYDISGSYFNGSGEFFLHTSQSGVSQDGSFLSCVQLMDDFVEQYSDRIPTDVQ